MPKYIFLVQIIAGSLRQDEAWDLPTGTGVVLR